MKISEDPFMIRILNGAGAEVFAINGMIYDEYLNWVLALAFTEKGDLFKGIFGLGERASHDFFFKNGVYSMWNKDS